MSKNGRDSHLLICGVPESLGRLPCRWSPLRACVVTGLSLGSPSSVEDETYHPLRRLNSLPF